MASELLPEELEALLSGTVDWKPDEQMKATSKRLRERGKVGDYIIPCPHCTNVFGESIYESSETDGPISCYVCNDVAYKCEEQEYINYNERKQQAINDLKTEKQKWLSERKANTLPLSNIEERVAWIEEFIYEKFFAEQTKERVVRNYKK